MGLGDEGIEEDEVEDDIFEEQKVPSSNIIPVVKDRYDQTSLSTCSGVPVAFDESDGTVIVVDDMDIYKVVKNKGEDGRKAEVECKSSVDSSPTAETVSKGGSDVIEEVIFMDCLVQSLLNDSLQGKKRESGSSSPNTSDSYEKVEHFSVQADDAKVEENKGGCIRKVEESSPELNTTQPQPPKDSESSEDGDCGPRVKRYIDASGSIRNLRW